MQIRIKHKALLNVLYVLDILFELNHGNLELELLSSYF